MIRLSAENIKRIKLKKNMGEERRDPLNPPILVDCGYKILHFQTLGVEDAG
jgi:hypothetical protein